MTDDSTFFGAAQALAQSLSQWDLLIIGGSLIVIVSSDYYRPASRRMRAVYLLFLPAWLCLAISVYEGFRVQEFYVAYLIAARAASAKSASIINQIAESIENATRYQIGSLEIALLCLAIWLGVYIVWWVRSNEPGGKGK